MRSLSRVALACAVGALTLAGSVRTAGAVIITVPGPAGTSVSVGTSGDSSCAQGTVAVSTGDCTNGFVAASATGSSFGGVAVSGTGTANTDSDLTPVAVSGTNEAGGCGDLGAASVSGTGYSQGCAYAVSVAGQACGTGSPEADVTVAGTVCSSPRAPITVCPRCLLGLHTTAATGSWEARGLRRF